MQEAKTMMTRIIFVAFTFSVIGSLPGCGGNAIEEQPKPAGETAAQTSELIEIFAADAPYNASGRHYQLSWGLTKTFPEYHALHVHEFIKAPGEGIARMNPYYYWAHLIEIIPEGPELDATEVHLYHDPHTGKTEQSAEANRPYSLEIDELMAYPNGKFRKITERLWHVSNRRLVSTNRESGPAVYEQDIAEFVRLEGHEQVSTGENTPKRPLDEFELAALPILRQGGEVVVKTTPFELRLLGAVRAQNQCISCHKCEAGALLGAFTYKLDLKFEATLPENRLKDTTGLLAEELSAVEAIEKIGGKLIRDPSGPVSEICLTYERCVNMKARGDYRGPHSDMRQLKNSALKHLMAFPALQILDVSNSLITDRGIPDIAKLKQLRKLNVKETKITEAGIAELMRALPQCEIEYDLPKPKNNLPIPTLLLPKVP